MLGTLEGPGKMGVVLVVGMLVSGGYDGYGRCG